MVTQVRNEATIPRSFNFRFVLPIDAFISNFTMTSRGETFVGAVKPKEDVSGMLVEVIEEDVFGHL